MLTKKELRDLEEMEELIRGAVYAALLIKVAIKFIRAHTQCAENEVIDA